MGELVLATPGTPMCVWLRAPSHNKDQGGRILSKRAGRSGWEFIAPRRDTGLVSFYSSGGGQQDLGSIRIDDGVWHHVALTFNELSEMRSYVDGRLDGKITHIVRKQAEAELWLGARTATQGRFIGDL